VRDELIVYTGNLIVAGGKHRILIRKVGPTRREQGNAVHLGPDFQSILAELPEYGLRSANIGPAAGELFKR
jgi:hypothetical protein